jgi:hypothetical protein
MAHTVPQWSQARRPCQQATCHQVSLQSSLLLCRQVQRAGTAACALEPPAPRPSAAAEMQLPQTRLQEQERQEGSISAPFPFAVQLMPSVNPCNKKSCKNEEAVMASAQLLPSIPGRRKIIRTTARHAELPVCMPGDSGGSTEDFRLLRDSCRTFRNGLARNCGNNVPEWCRSDFVVADMRQQM